MSPPRSSLQSIPLEITEHALSFCHPTAVVAVARTCRPLYRLIFCSPDNFLWRQLFLAYPFDDPRKSLKAIRNPGLYSVSDFDWKDELVRRLKAEVTAFGGGGDDVSARKEALQAFISIVENANPETGIYPSLPSDSLEWLERVLQNSRMLDSSPEADRGELMLASRLRSYLALSIDYARDERSQSRMRRIRTNSRCVVYDLRNYHEGNKWGPFLADGSINWVHIEAIINVVLTNLKELPLTAAAKPPVGLQSTRAFSAPGKVSTKDWAGVEGTWRRYVCFMDYRDLYAFNYSDISNGPRNPSFFTDLSFREATRLIELKLHLVSANELNFRIVPADVAADKNAEYPPLFFSGTSRGLSGSGAVVEGWVRMGADGTVRWQFASIYDGHTQWSSEGVQIGNIASAVGVAGSWTTAVHDQGDPVGPFWLWKVGEDYTETLVEYN